MHSKRKEELQNATLSQLLAWLDQAGEGDGEHLFKEVYEQAMDDDDLAVIDDEVKRIAALLRSSVGRRK